MDPMGTEWEPEVPGQFNTPLRVRRQRAATEAAYFITPSYTQQATAPTTDHPIDWETKSPSPFNPPFRIRHKRAAADAEFPGIELGIGNHTPVSVVQPIAPKDNYFAPIARILATTFRIFYSLFSATGRRAGAIGNSIQGVAGSRQIIEIRKIAADGFESVKRRAIGSGTTRPIAPSSQQIIRSTRPVSHPTPSRKTLRQYKHPKMTSSLKTLPGKVSPLPEALAEQSSSSSESSVEQIRNPQVQAPKPPIDLEALGEQLWAKFTPPPLPGSRESLVTTQRLAVASASVIDGEPNPSLITDMPVENHPLVEKLDSSVIKLSPNFGKTNRFRRSPPRKIALIDEESRALLTKMRNKKSCLQHRQSLPQLSASETKEQITERRSVSEETKRARFAINPTNGLPEAKSIRFYRESKIGEWAPSSPWAEDPAHGSTSDFTSKLEDLLGISHELEDVVTYPSSIELGDDSDNSYFALDLLSELNCSPPSGRDESRELVEDANGSKKSFVDKVSNSPTGQSGEPTNGRDSKNTDLENAMSRLKIPKVQTPYLEMSDLGKAKIRTQRRERWAAAVAKKAAEEAAAAKAKAEAEEAERKSRANRRTPKEKLVKPLSEEWEAKIQVALSHGDHVPLTTTISGTDLRRKDFMTVLGERSWLNDEIINAYLEWIVDYSNKKAGRDGRNAIPKVIAHNSFFYKNIATQGPQSVSRWMKRKKAEGKKLLEVETVLIPVNNASHWTIIVVSPQQRTIEYLDSFAGNSKVFINNTKAWLAAELGSAWHEDEWRVLNTQSAAQLNGFDCGVFTITNAECVAGGIATDSYDWADMANQRRRIAAVLLNRGFGAGLIPAEEM